MASMKFSLIEKDLIDSKTLPVGCHEIHILKVNFVCSIDIYWSLDVS